jgi:hypothetical protein
MKEITMEAPMNGMRVLLALAGVLALSNCATTQETVQDCKKSASSYCDRTVGAKGASAGGPGAADPAARNAAYQKCMDTQLETCRAQ